MTDQHPTVTPPPELRAKWMTEARSQDYCSITEQVADYAAQWGYEQRGEVNEAKLQKARDEELEACSDWLCHEYGYGVDLALKLRAARRPKPQTLSSIALQALDTIEHDARYLPEITDTIRRAILRLKQLEDSNG